MTRPRHFWQSPQEFRTYNQRAIELAETVHQREEMLINLLYEMDQRRIYTRFGYKSLRGYCEEVLKFTRTQSQRLVSKVRCYEPSPKPNNQIVVEKENNKEMIIATRRLLQRPKKSIAD